MRSRQDQKIVPFSFSQCSIPVSFMKYFQKKKIKNLVVIFSPLIFWKSAESFRRLDLGYAEEFCEEGNSAAGNHREAEHYALLIGCASRSLVAPCLHSWRSLASALILAKTDTSPDTSFPPSQSSGSLPAARYLPRGRDISVRRARGGDEKRVRVV